MESVTFYHLYLLISIYLFVHSHADVVSPRAREVTVKATNIGLQSDPNIAKGDIQLVNNNTNTKKNNNTDTKKNNNTDTMKNNNSNGGVSPGSTDDSDSKTFQASTSAPPTIVALVNNKTKPIKTTTITTGAQSLRTDIDTPTTATTTTTTSTTAKLSSSSSLLLELTSITVTTVNILSRKVGKEIDEPVVGVKDKDENIEITVKKEEEEEEEEGEGGEDEDEDDGDPIKQPTGLHKTTAGPAQDEGGNEGIDGYEDDDDHDLKGDELDTFSNNIESEFNDHEAEEETNEGEASDPHKDYHNDHKQSEYDKSTTSSSHFMTTMVIIILLVALLYVVYHNRHKILAYIVEGRNRKAPRRRLHGSVDYKKLPSGEETLPQPDEEKNAKSYIY